MKQPSFATREGVEWLSRGRALEARIDDVTFTAHPSRLTASWIVVGTSKLALPINAVVYIARSGAAHGYWRNVTPRLTDYFAYSDVPALMPVIVGRQTWRAVHAHDATRSDGDEPLHSVELHIHGRTIETTTRVEATSSRVIDDQLAIHQALASDHAAVLDAWQSAADALGGHVATSWPPVLTVPRGFGAATISLHWPPSTHASARASIELSADARGAKLWSLEREPSATPNTHELADRHFLVMGEIPIPVDSFTREIARADILSINVRRHVTVAIAGYAPDAAILDAVLELMAAIVGAPAEPYR